MNKQWIKNTTQLTTTQSRQKVLEIIEEGFNAINTEKAIRSSVSLSENNLKISDQTFSLEGINNVFVIGFGKASCLAASIIDEILGSTIKEGVAIGLAPIACEYIQTYGGTHPHPSIQNVALSQKIMDLSEKLTEKDLVIVIVSGGGSALLCWPMKECEQANRLYQEFLKTGGNIKELNTVRKHISLLKGGGLAKHLFPATVIGLIFSDVPGDNFKLVASGPTYKDETTIADAQTVLDKYNLKNYNLKETPKEDSFFKKVVNIPLVSNLDALEAMKRKAESLGLKVKVLSSKLYGSPEQIANKFLNAIEPNCVVLGAGEPKTIIQRTDGTGGRCQRLGIEILPFLTENDVFAAVASDGFDNSSAAGIIEDRQTLQRMNELKIDILDFKNRWDSLGFYTQLGNELLQTGPTEANVSDLIIMYRK